jgi:hypothetical protein
MKISQQLLQIRTNIAYSFIRVGEILLIKGNRYRLSSRIDSILEVRRHQISDDITRRLNSTVEYGHFKGMSFANESIWGASDTANMLLGLYEREISDLLMALAMSENNRYLIDCGAADGFFAVGALVSGEFEFVWAFEQSKGQRINLRENAATNGVENRLEILGSAELDFLVELEKDEKFLFEKSTFLIDIEGGEFQILNEENLLRTKNSVLIIELHDFSAEQKWQRDLLFARAQKFHHGYLFSTGARDLSGIPELDYLSDSNRWLMCSEGRPRVMDWLVLFPLTMGNKLQDLGISHRAI